MATLVAHTKIQPAGSGGGTSSSIDTTGANLLVAVFVNDFGLSPTFSDSKSNTWISRSGHSTGDVLAYTELHYCLNPTVGSGHNFTLGGSGSMSGCIAAFKTAQAFDAQTAGTGSTTPVTIQGGSITAGFSPALIISTIGWLNNGGSAPDIWSIDSGFTVTDEVPNQTTHGCGLAYLSQAVASAVNPTWSLAITPHGSAAVNYSFAFSDDITSSVDITESPDVVAGVLNSTFNVSVAITESPDVIAAALNSTFNIAVAITESPDIVDVQMLAEGLLAIAITESPDAFLAEIGAARNIVINIGSEDADSVAIILENAGSWANCPPIDTDWTECQDPATTWTTCTNPTTDWTVN